MFARTVKVTVFFAVAPLIFLMYFYRPHTKYDGRYCFHSRVSLTLATGRGGGCLTTGGGCETRGVWPGQRTIPPPPPPLQRYRQHGNTVNERSVRILLECILVMSCVNITLKIHSTHFLNGNILTVRLNRPLIIEQHKAWKIWHSIFLKK